MVSWMKTVFKPLLPFAILCLTACGDSGQQLQCKDTSLTSECQGLLRSCGVKASGTPQTAIATSAAVSLTACLKRTYAARCNAACQVVE